MGGASATKFFLLLSAPFPLPLLHHRRSFLLLSRHCHHFFRPSFSSPFLHPLSPILSSSFQPISSSRHLHSHQDEYGRFQVSDSINSVSSSNSCDWPEWSNLLRCLSAAGFFRGVTEFVAVEDLPDEFLRAANACLAFARERPDLLGLLSRKDIEVLVESGRPYLFRDANDTVKKMQVFLQGNETNVSDSDRAQTIDLFKYIVSYARNPTVSSDGSRFSGDLVESSTRILLIEICKLCFSDPDRKILETIDQFSDQYGQSQGPHRQKVEMKRGDWICPRCSFMNFARNVKCLECEEARPKRQLTGGEWECPQCDFFNYGRNMVCLRCDCKRPGASPLGNININSSTAYENGSNAAKFDMDSRLAANEEKAQRWFSKISQMDSTSDSSITDEDFPEIMPLRKGVNRFVVSTKKTPLERRLANAEYRRNLGNDGAPENNGGQFGDTNKFLDNEQGPRINYAPSSGSGSTPYESSKGINSGYVPFVPLPSDMFAKKPGNSSMESEKVVTDTQKSDEVIGRVSQSQSNESKGDDRFSMENMPSQTEKIDNGKNEAEKSERWFKRVAELHNVTDLASAVSDEDFPEIMPMRKGENRFVVSRKKDRSLTSPAYKRRSALEQGNNSNFVPFVPFPPDYFAKKDKSLSNDSAFNTDKASSTSETTKTQTEQLGDDRLEDFADNKQTQTVRSNSERPVENFVQNEKDAEYPIRSSSENFASPKSDVENVSSLRKEANNNTREIENIREKWSGKSLEGSAVIEPDPLDMSEEAKAQRWFRRVAQIKDISELSQIPDEDFPSIMPMRKGVNRFVVSKRKTPLERRLTSPQYKRNLPIISSDPPKKENKGN